MDFPKLDEAVEAKDDIFSENRKPLHTALSVDIDESQAKGIAETSLGIGASEEEFEADHMLIYNEETLRTGLQLIGEAVKEEPIIALGCEREKSSDFEARLITLATRNKALLIDLLALGSASFDIGIRALLEDENITKLMFDCRQDLFSLSSQFKVKLDGVLDIKLLEVLKRSGYGFTENNSLRRIRQLIPKVRKQLWCVEHVLCDRQTVQGMGVNNGTCTDIDCLDQPLSAEQLTYAKTRVLSFFILFDKMHPNAEELIRLDIASRVYVEFTYSVGFHVYTQYAKHNYLPISVIPEQDRSDFDFGCIKCADYRLMFLPEEFSKARFEERGQRCRACKCTTRYQYDEQVRKLENIIHQTISYRELYGITNLLHCSATESDNGWFDDDFHAWYERDDSYDGNESEYGCTVYESSLDCCSHTKGNSFIGYKSDTKQNNEHRYDRYKRGNRYNQYDSEDVYCGCESGNIRDWCEHYCIYDGHKCETDLREYDIDNVCDGNGHESDYNDEMFDSDYTCDEDEADYNDTVYDSEYACDGDGIDYSCTESDVNYDGDGYESDHNSTVYESDRNSTVHDDDHSRDGYESDDSSSVFIDDHSRDWYDSDYSRYDYESYSDDDYDDTIFDRRYYGFGRYSGDSGDSYDSGY